MIWTAEEKAKIKIVKISRKNTFLRYCMIPVIILVTLYFAFYRLIQNNLKKLSLVCCICVVNIMYCSFSFPLFIQTSSSDSEYTEGEEVSFAEEYNLDTKDSLEDSFVKTSENNSEIYDGLIYDGFENEGLETQEDSALEYEDFYLLDDVLELPIPSGKKEIVETEVNAEELTFDADDWRLVLINKQNSIPQDYEISLGSIKTMKGDRKCDSRIIDELLQMISDAKQDGVTLAICSPYRDMQYQEKLFKRKIVKFTARGMSYLEAYQKAGETVTVPGASEHQIGLALDIVSNTYTSLDSGFGLTEAGKWLKENSYRYGFILRYPENKEYITGIAYEPWHYRYVGKEAASIIMKNEITLEEFWQQYLDYK